ncbi:MAG: PAS domain S-box protein [Magnetococcales bacterium]|nr:PAS domain S-box protein [Magnetococcales bacterium]
MRSLLPHTLTAKLVGFLGISALPLAVLGLESYPGLTMALWLALLLLGSLLGRALSRSLTQITAALTALEEGRAAQPLPAARRDEIGLLASRVAGLARHLHKQEQERQKREEAMLERLSTLQLQQAVVDQHSILSSADAKGTILSVNDLFVRISGYDREELIGKNHRLVKSGHHSPAFFQEMWRTISAGQVWHGEIKNRAKGGSHYWVSATIVPSVDEQGKPFRYHSIRTDITHQKEMEEAMARQSRFMLGIANAMGEGVFALDQQGRCTYLNTTGARLLGWRFEELKDRILHDRIHHRRPDGSSIPMEECPALNALRAGRGYRSDELSFVRRNGTLFPVALVADPLLDEQGRLTGSVWVFQDISENKRVELALKESERRLRNIVSNAHELIYSLDGQGTIQFIAPTVRELLGYEPERLHCRPFSHLVDLVDVEKHQQALQAVLQNREPVRGLEYRLRQADGQEKWFRGSISPVLDDNGLVEAVVGIDFDITELHQVSKKLQENETRLRNILDNTHDIILTLRREGIINFATPSIARHLGHTPERLVGRHISLLLHPEDLESFLTALEETSQGTQSLTNHESRFLASQGAVHWLRYSMTPVADTGNRSASLVMSATDITHQKQQEQALHASEAKFRILFESTGEGVLLLGQQGLMDCNEKAVELLGCRDRADLLNRSIQEFWPERQPDGTPSHVLADDHRNKAFEEGSHSCEWIYRLANGGGEIPTEVLLTALALDGKPALQIVIRDITARKEMEAQLRTAKDVAESASQARGAFLANMSHEIRTPMNAIIGLSHLCLQTPLTTRQQDYIRKVHSSATYLLRIINDVLDFSKIEADRLEMESIAFSLADVLDNVASIVSVQTREKELECLMKTSLEIPALLLGDPLRLGQILLNLANNAIKFTEQGEVAVVTDVVEQDEGRVRLRFSVRDTGIGMSPEQLGGLFQAFTQADSSITRKFGGTGLGLTISKRLIEMMGGTIRVESTLGVGSQFIVEIPFGVSSPQQKKRWVPATDLRGMKVLAVDDNESALNVLAYYLTAFTFWVSKAQSGAEAMMAIQEADRAGDPFDLVVMDYHMPGMDGLEVAGQINHALQLTRVPPILIATAAEERLLEQAGQKAGIAGVLRKPIHQSLLFSTILELFGEAVPSPNRRDEAVATRQARIALAGARLLLVEDNELNQQVAQELLTQANLTVVLAENGQQALERLAEGGVDGILMDLHMPVMDGLTATRAIRREARFDHLPILAMTANAMAGDREACLAVGMQDHIAKPIDPDKLFVTLARWIKPSLSQPLPAEVIPAQATPMAPAATDPVRPLPSIPGLDLQVGLRHMNGNPSAYWGVLAKFRTNQGGAIAALEAALAAGEQATAERLVHTLKGVAATIGAYALRAKTEQLESAIKKPTDAGERRVLLQETAAELATLCAALDQVLPPAPPFSPSLSVITEGGAGIARRDALLREAHRQLSVFDAAVEESVAELRAAHLSEAMQPWIVALEKQITHYDFEGAAVTLRACADALGVALESSPDPSGLQ